jgi:hypothetical protein
MERLIREIVEDINKQDVVAGNPVDIGGLSKADQRKLVTIAVHFCLNGPVSTHKSTTFPIIGETSVDEVVGKRVTNNSMKSFCHIVKGFIEPGIDCNQVRILGEYWPKE